MSDMQSTLGSQQGIAEELAEDQRQISIAEFFEKNKHMLGFDSPGRSIVTAVKEAVDNALDASEEAGFLPEISVEITEEGEYYRVTIEDNGPGITEEQVPKVFGRLLYGSRFGKREQNRGQQGIGISAAVLYSQLTSGRPARITSKTTTQDDGRFFKLVIDTDDNTAEIRETDTVEWDKNHGTRIELEMDANMRARQQLHRYIQHTAVVNPHATIRMSEPSKSLEYERTTDDLPEDTKEIQPHPHGVELGTLLKMFNATDSYSVSGFLQQEFTRVGQKTAENIVSNFRDRHYGRAMAWRIPEDTEYLRDVLTDAVQNKGKEPTQAFVDELLEQLSEYVAHHELQSTVQQAADDSMDAFGKTFGATVQENAVRAAWGVIAGDAEDELVDMVDAATSNRKGDATIQVMGEEINKALRNIDGRHRIKLSQLENVVSEAADAAEDRDEDVTIGSTAQENIVEEIWGRTRTVPDEVPKVDEIGENRNIASEFLASMNSADVLAPPTDCLSPITSDLIEQGMKKVYDADFYASSTRDASVHSGDPFIAEAGIAYGGSLNTGGSAEPLRFANRVPLVYMQGSCATATVTRGINWRNYKVSQPGGEGLPEENMVILVHVASTNVPFTSESKDAVAKVEEIMDEVELAIREAARELKSYLKRKSDLRERQEKRSALRDMFPTLSQKAASISECGEPNWRIPLANIMNDVLVKREAADDDGKSAVTIENYTRQTKSFTIVQPYAEKPDGRQTPQDGEVVEVDDGFELHIEGELESSEEVTYTYPSAEMSGAPRCADVEEELVTVEVEDESPANQSDDQTTGE